MSNSVFFYEPFYDFDRFFETFSPLVNNTNALQTTRRSTDDNAVRQLRPRMDLHENAEKNLVTATFELPGLKKEDVNIDLHDGRLTVSGDAKISEEHEENGYAVRERRFGKFSRTLQLPQGVKENEIKASMENGILTVTFPKSTPELAPKRITVA
ncbi:putative small heat shock protein (HSP20) family protein [Lyophyllum shimeji]|uniref:Small heat shock protein (HSP20) family protein n=1 Tax=Lyophyllum shimeji TaxID=47721 RepID=A0A9P3URN6_LYOSH|nr:putative small heat shock protein (HSP20) family protein [Lyophyllum shimeji]